MQRRWIRVALVCAALLTSGLAAATLSPTHAAAQEPGSAPDAAAEARAELRVAAEAGISSEQKEVRHYSVLALGAMLGDKELKDFRKYTQDTDPVVRNAALLALALRSDKKAIAAIEDLLAKTDAAELEPVLMSLVHRLDDKTRGEIFKKILKKPATEALRQGVVRYLARYGSEAAFGLVDGLDKLKDAEARSALVAILVAQPRPDALRIAESLAKSKDAAVRLEALQLAGAIANHDAWQLVSRAVEDSDEGVRHKAEAMLIAQRHPNAAAVLGKRLADNPKDSETIGVLLELEPPDLAAQLEPLVAGENPSLAQADYNRVLALVAASKSDAAKALVRTKLASTYESDRIAAAFALGFTEDRGFTAEATALLDDGSLEVRKAIAESLGRLKDPSALDAMGKKLAAGTTVREVKLRLVRSMGEIGDPGAVNSLQFLMTDRDHEVRLATIEALAVLKAQDATRAIEVVANDPDPLLRWKAVVAMFRIDPVVYGERLKKAVSDAPEDAFFETLAELDDATRAKLEEEVLRGDRAALGAALVRGWASQGRPALAQLRNAIDLSKDNDVLHPAFEALASFAEPEDQARVERFLDDGDRRIRLLALHTLLSYDKASTEAAFRAQTTSDDPLFKAIGIYGLVR